MSVFQPPPRRPFDHDSDIDVDDPPAEDGYMNITNVYSDSDPEVTQAATTPIAKATSSLTGGKRGDSHRVARRLSLQCSHLASHR